MQPQVHLLQLALILYTHSNFSTNSVGHRHYRYHNHNHIYINFPVTILTPTPTFTSLLSSTDSQCASTATSITLYKLGTCIPTYSSSSSSVATGGITVTTDVSHSCMLMFVSYGEYNSSVSSFLCVFVLIGRRLVPSTPTAIPPRHAVEVVVPHHSTPGNHVNATTPSTANANQVQSGTPMLITMHPLSQRYRDRS